MKSHNIPWIATARSIPDRRAVRGMGSCFCRPRHILSMRKAERLFRPPFVMRWAMRPPSFSARGPFLEGGGKALMESIQREIFDRVADGSLSPEDAEAQQMMLLGEAQRLAYDKTGRIVLPELFRTHADLSSSATFVGLGNRF